jgi:hypothetical protein
MLLSFFYDYLAYQARHWGCTPVILATPEAKIGKIVVQGQLGRDGGVWKKKKKKTAESLKEEDLSIHSGKKQDFISKITSAKKGWR